LSTKSTMQRIELEAETLNQARAEIRPHVPAGSWAFVDAVLSDGKPGRAVAYGETAQEAAHDARQKLPPGAEIVEEHLDRPPVRQIVLVRARDEISASVTAKAMITGLAHTHEVRLRRAATRLLGIQVTPGEYEVDFLLETACVVIDYRVKARIAVVIEAEDRIAETVRKTIRQTRGLEAPRVGPDGETYPGARYWAARELGKIAHPSAVDELIKWLKDEDHDVRIESALALGCIESPAAIGPLLELALDDRHLYHRDTRAAAVVAIRRIAGSNATQALANVPRDTILMAEHWLREHPKITEIRARGYL
jgi:hypothetical protein